MTNRPFKNTSHLKQGKAYPDPIATAKATGGHWSNSASHTEITPTDGTPKAADGHLGGKNSPDGGRGWAPMDAVTKRNTTTGEK